MRVISLFDKTTTFLAPWLEAGYKGWAIDIRHPPGITRGDRPNLYLVGRDLSQLWIPGFSPDSIAFVAAFPPCTHLAVSGARWFKGKGLRLLAQSIELFATAAEFAEWSGAPYLIENPVSTISTYWRKPDYFFHPHWFTGYEPNDNYVKKTCLWTGGGFVMPNAFVNEYDGNPDYRIHHAGPSPDRGDFRAQTPMGFARAIFEANEGVRG